MHIWCAEADHWTYTGEDGEWLSHSKMHDKNHIYLTEYDLEDFTVHIKEAPLNKYLYVSDEKRFGYHIVKLTDKKGPATKMQIDKIPSIPKEKGGLSIFNVAK